MTGLIWLKNAACLSSVANRHWAPANQAAAGLMDGACGLTDKSAPGDWRLPTKDEWSATIAPAVALGCTGIYDPTLNIFHISLTDNAGTLCLFAGNGPSYFQGIGGFTFAWSSSSDAVDPVKAWEVNLRTGTVVLSSSDKSISTAFVWPVRR